GGGDPAPRPSTREAAPCPPAARAGELRENGGRGRSRREGVRGVMSRTRTRTPTRARVRLSSEPEPGRSQAGTGSALGTVSGPGTGPRAGGTPPPSPSPRPGRKAPVRGGPDLALSPRWE